MGRWSPKAQAPKYMEAFQCVGAACPENCCTGWTVSVDKPTFRRYREVTLQPLAEVLHRHVQRTQGGGDSYARIVMKPDGACPVLDEAGLCQIHSQLGPEALSRTCTDYPRQYSQDGDRLGVRATLSCPEAARLALTQADALDPIELTLPFTNASLVPLHVRRGPPPSDADPVRRNGALLGQVIGAALRSPGLTAVEALVVLGLMLRRVARDCQGPEGSDVALAEAVEHYLSDEHLERAPALIQALPVSKTLQLDLLLGTTQRFVRTEPVRPLFKQLLEQVGAGLGEGQGLDAMAARLAAVEREQFQPFEARHPFVWKNLLLNEFAYAMFPKGGAADIEREFMGIVVKFALIKLYACGLMAHRGADFSLDDVVRVTYVVSRAITHNRRFLPNLLQTLQDHDALRLDVMTQFVL